MQVIIGGAYSGKRKIVKGQFDGFGLTWLSSYEEMMIDSWKDRWQQDTHLILEGWENWLREDVRTSDSLNTLRERYNEMFREMLDGEASRKKQVILIMLEVGKGIVPKEVEDRRLRDLAGWIQQDAILLSEEVHYVWHGLSRRIK